MSIEMKMRDPRPLCRMMEPEILLQEVWIEDLRVAADIGVHAHEMGRRQALIVDARLSLRPPSGDHLAETLDYNRVVEYAVALAEERIALIETFARRLALACLEHDGVLRAEIVVKKPGALANGLAGTRIVIQRDRSDWAPC